MFTLESISIPQLRRYVVARQGFSTRFRRARPNEVEETIRRLSCVQLDSISTVDRSHRLVISSRAGAYRAGTVPGLLRAGRVFEYWAHEACLCPIEDFPLFKNRMQEFQVHHWFGPVIQRDPDLAEQVLDAIRERGPLGSRHFEGAGSGGMWNWKPAKRMLEALFAAGQLVVASREHFQRLYDLPERVIPRAYLEAPAPSHDEFVRGLAVRAVHARGALTERGIADHYRLPGGAGGVRSHVDVLVREGLLRRVALQDGDGAVVVPADAELDGDVAAAGALLSPFDNLLWDRDSPSGSSDSAM